MARGSWGTQLYAAPQSEVLHLPDCQESKIWHVLYGVGCGTDCEVFVRNIKNMKREFLVYNLSTSFLMNSHLYFSLPRLQTRLPVSGVNRDSGYGGPRKTKHLFQINWVRENKRNFYCLKPNFQVFFFPMLIPSS